MSTIELLIVATTPGLAGDLACYAGIETISATSPGRANSLISGSQPPQAVYLEDTCGTLEELWSVLRAAQARGIAVLIGLRNIGIDHRADFVDSGLAVTQPAESPALAAWIAEQLGLRRRASDAPVTIAVAGAKGGIGKSLVVALLAEGLRRRGLNILVVDGDISNSGLVPTFRIPSGFPSYLHITGDASVDGRANGIWNTQNVRKYIYHHQASAIDFLLGSEETTDARDLQRSGWQALMQAVRGLTEYDVVLLDTGPEIKKRPYAILAARDGGWVVLPTPPGRKERTGVGNMLRTMQAAVADRDLSERCFLLYMAPEQGVTVNVDQITPLFARHFPNARPLGTLPRSPRQVSTADEEGDRYISPLDVAPHSRFSRSVHQFVDQLCHSVGLRPPAPMPRSSFFQRLRGERPVLQPNQTTRINTGEVRA